MDPPFLSSPLLIQSGSGAMLLQHVTAEESMSSLDEQHFQAVMFNESSQHSQAALFNESVQRPQAAMFNECAQHPSMV